MTTYYAYNTIMQSDLFRLDGQSIDLCQSILGLCECIQNEDETDWYSGEGLECCLADFLIGAYWALTECHAGQYSDSYAALCAIGAIYSPGISHGPEDDSLEHEAYEAVCEYLLKD